MVYGAAVGGAQRNSLKVNALTQFRRYRSAKPRMSPELSGHRVSGRFSWKSARGCARDPATMSAVRYRRAGELGAPPRSLGSAPQAARFSRNFSTCSARAFAPSATRPLRVGRQELDCERRGRDVGPARDGLEFLFLKPPPDTSRATYSALRGSRRPGRPPCRGWIRSPARAQLGDGIATSDHEPALLAPRAINGSTSSMNQIAAS